MSIRRGSLDPATAEQLLRGDGVGARTGSDALAALLADAAAPAQHAELAGEQAAVLAYRSAHRAVATPPAKRSAVRTFAGKALTAKAAAVLAATVVGGIAVAAGTGNLPGRHSPTTPATTQPSTPSQPPSPGGSSGEPGSSTASTGAPAGTGTPTASTSTVGIPVPGLVGRCRAFLAGAGDNPGKALDNPAFAVLIRAAGGRDHVAAYCQALLASTPPASATPTTQPAPHPTGRPTAHPTGPPTDHSTGPPTSHPGHPTGRPTQHPTGH